MKKFLTYLTLLLLLFQQMGGITYAAEQYEITVNLSWSCERYHYDPITVEIRLGNGSIASVIFEPSYDYNQTKTIEVSSPGIEPYNIIGWPYGRGASRYPGGGVFNIDIQYDCWGGREDIYYNVVYAPGDYGTFWEEYYSVPERDWIPEFQGTLTSYPGWEFIGRESSIGWFPTYMWEVYSDITYTAQWIFVEEEDEEFVCINNGLYRDGGGCYEDEEDACTMNGWYRDEYGGICYESEEEVCIMNGGYRDGGVCYNFEEETYYTITINSNGGGSVGNPENYNVSGEIQTRTLMPPTAPSSSISSGTTYTVSFNPQGGSPTPSSVTSTNTITTNSSFSTWTITTNSTPTESSVTGNTLTIPANSAGDIEIRADWSLATGLGFHPSVTLPGAPTRDGYNFSGRYTAASCGGTKAGDVGGIYTPSATITLHACWTADSYTIIYSGNGGTLSECTPTSYTIESATITPTCSTTIRDGYIFAGFTSTNIPTGSTGNQTIIANWNAVDYTITINSNGGGAVSNPENYNISGTMQTRTLTRPLAPKGTTYTVSFDTNGGSANPGNVTSTNTIMFDTWNITTNSTPGSNISSDTLNILSNAIGNMTVRADWSTGSHPSVMCASTPTKTGYIFNGWYTAVSAGTKRCNANGSYIPDTNEALYAQWIISTPPGGGGGGGSTPDYCPNGDFSPSRYDGTCGEPPIDSEGQNEHGSATKQDENDEDTEDNTNPLIEPIITPPSTEKEIYEWAKEEGITSMGSFEDFRREEGITRAEMAKLVSIYATEYNIKTPDHSKYQCREYTDLDTAPEGLRNYVITSCELGYMGYYSDGETYKSAFVPNEIITKAEAVTVLSRVLWGTKYKGTEHYWYHSHYLAIYKIGVVEERGNPMMYETRGHAITMINKLTSLFNRIPFYQ